MADSVTGLLAGHPRPAPAAPRTRGSRAQRSLGGHYDPAIRRLLRLSIPAIAAALLAACGGGQKSTLSPAPGPSGQIALARLTANPEVYADATVETVGTVVAARLRHARHYFLAGAKGPRVVLEPSNAVAGDLGRRVRVTGTFTVTFELGYEILVARIRPTANRL